MAERMRLGTADILYGVVTGTRSPSRLGAGIGRGAGRRGAEGVGWRPAGDRRDWVREFCVERDEKASPKVTASKVSPSFRHRSKFLSAR